jgi:hypothetical protein
VQKFSSTRILKVRILVFVPRSWQSRLWNFALDNAGWVEEEFKTQESLSKGKQRVRDRMSSIRPKGKRMPNPEVILFENLMNRRYVLLTYWGCRFSTSAGALSHWLDIVTYTLLLRSVKGYLLFVYYRHYCLCCASLAWIQRDCRQVWSHRAQYSRNFRMGSLESSKNITHVTAHSWGRTGAVGRVGNVSESNNKGTHSRRSTFVWTCGQKMPIFQVKRNALREVKEVRQFGLIPSNQNANFKLQVATLRSRQYSQNTGRFLVESQWCPGFPNLRGLLDFTNFVINQPCNCWGKLGNRKDGYDSFGDLTLCGCVGYIPFEQHPKLLFQKCPMIAQFWRELHVGTPLSEIAEFFKVV